ncbi:hypothetical protein [Salinibacter sp.]
MKEHYGALTGIFMAGTGGGAIVPLIVGSCGDGFALRPSMFFLPPTFE